MQMYFPTPGPSDATSAGAGPRSGTEDGWHESIGGTSCTCNTEQAAWSQDRRRQSSGEKNGSEWKSST